VDGNRFDSFARLAAASRRQALKGLAGGAAGALLALFGVKGARSRDAICQPIGQGCEVDTDCCFSPGPAVTCVGGICRNSAMRHYPCQSDADCGLGGCLDGVCKRCNKLLHKCRTDADCCPEFGGDIRCSLSLSGDGICEGRPGCGGRCQ
jgi:hypothetical protein